MADYQLERSEGSRVLLLGAYGLIGLACARRLHTAGHDVTGLGRSANTGTRLMPEIRWISRDIGKCVQPSQWRDLLDGIDVVVNASGALQDGARDDLKSVQDDAIQALVAASEAAGVKRFVQISAPGAELDASTEFLRTKARADARLQQAALDWIILRPGLVIGAAAYGGSAFLRMLSGIPIVQPMVFGDRKIQTVALSDVAQVVERAVAGHIPAGSDLDLVEPEAHSLRDIVEKLRRWLGVPAARLELGLPEWLARLFATVSDWLGHLGWRPPLRTTALTVIAEDIRGDPRPLRTVLGRELMTLDQTLLELPAGLQERWFARLYLLLPMLVATLSAFWLATGVIGLMDVGRAAEAVPAEAMAPWLAQSSVVVGALVDLALGAVILFRPWARAACVGMIAMTLFYLVMGSLLTPDLWLDPLGPFIKTIPAMALALVAFVLLEER